VQGIKLNISPAKSLLITVPQLLSKCFSRLQLRAAKNANDQDARAASSTKRGAHTMSNSACIKRAPKTLSPCHGSENKATPEWKERKLIKMYPAPAWREVAQPVCAAAPSNFYLHRNTIYKTRG